MANRRVLVRRRKTARNIRKITRTMQLIATSRFQAAHNLAVASRPYTDKLAELVADLAHAGEGLDHPLLAARPEAAGSALVVLTSNRGLCGGYNSNVLRSAVEHLDGEAAGGRQSRVQMVGKKGVAFFRFLGRPVAEAITTLGDFPKFGQIEPLANQLMERFVRGEIAAVHVAHMRFLSAGRQQPVVSQLLPMSTPTVEGQTIGPTVEYEFSPAPQEILQELLPATVRIGLYQAFLDAAVSEQVARMVAMKAATDAAGDMIKRLTQQYNRARQTAITMELLDIVGGANALA